MIASQKMAVVRVYRLPKFVHFPADVTQTLG
jgi:hypothetical protein